MLSLHTQVENLANLLHQRRAERGCHVDRLEAYRNLVAAILEVPVGSVVDTAAFQPAFVPVVAAIPTRRRNAA